MIYAVFSIAIISLLVFTLHLKSEVNRLSKKIEPETSADEVEIILIEKPMPKFEDIDSTSETLNSLLYTIKSEEWSCDTKKEISGSGWCYDVEFHKPNSKTHFRCRLRTFDNKARIAWATLLYIEGNESRTISFEKKNAQIIRFIWSYIDKKNKIEIETEENRLIESKNIVSKLFKKLKRDKAIDKIFDNE